MFQKEIWDTLWTQQRFADWDDGSDLVYKVLIKEIGNLKNKRILEAGSGTGRISLALSEDEAKVTLMDFSETALLQSKQRFKEAGLHGEFILADIFNMEGIPDNSYDVVWNAGVLEHFDYEQQVKAMKEMNRVLKSDGLLISLNPNAKCLPYQLGKWFMESTNQWPYGQELPIFTMEKVCRKVGLNFIKEYSVGLEQSLNFLSQIPNSDFMKQAIEKWCNNLSDQYKENMEGYLKVTVCKKNKDNDKKDNVDLYNVRESQKKKNIIMLSSIHLIDDLWQRHQQLATEFINYGYQVVFVNNVSKTININREFAKLQESEIEALFLKVIIESSTIEKIIMIDRIDFIKDCNGHIYNIQDYFIKYVISFFSNQNSKIITYLPDFSSILVKIKKELNIEVYYDCVDEMTGFYSSKKVVLNENELLQSCDGVIVTSNTLYVRKGKKNQNCILVPNGVDFNNYSVKREKPDDITDFNGPIIGYVGAIAHWFDQDIICNLAKKYPSWNFVLIGSVYTNVDKLKMYSNIHLLGKREYSLVPKYMQHFDVGIIPFKSSELIVNTNPIKYYEYIAAGIPVVSTMMPELIGKPNVHIASSLDEFKAGIENALRFPNEVVGIDFLQKNSWSERASKIMQFINNDSIMVSRKETLLNISSLYENNIDKLTELHLLLAEIHFELENDNKAKHFLDEFVHKASQQSPLAQTRLYLHLKDLGEVYRVLKFVDDYSNYDTEVWKSKGERYLNLYALRKVSAFEEALKLADQLLEEDDRSYIEEVGNIYYDVEQYEDAFKFYIEAFSIKGKLLSLEGTVKFANILHEKGEDDLVKKVIEPYYSLIKSSSNISSTELG